MILQGCIYFFVCPPPLRFACLISFMFSPKKVEMSVEPSTRWSIKVWGFSGAHEIIRRRLNFGNFCGGSRQVTTINDDPIILLGCATRSNQNLTCKFWLKNWFSNSFVVKIVTFGRIMFEIFYIFLKHLKISAFSTFRPYFFPVASYSYHLVDSEPVVSDLQICSSSKSSFSAELCSKYSIFFRTP